MSKGKEEPKYENFHHYEILNIRNLEIEGAYQEERPRQKIAS